MNEKFSLIGSGRIWGSFKNFVDREIRERRRGERRLYERHEASAPGEKLVRRRRTKLSHC